MPGGTASYYDPRSYTPGPSAQGGGNMSNWFMQRMTGMLPTPAPLPSPLDAVSGAIVRNPRPSITPSNVATVRG